MATPPKKAAAAKDPVEVKLVKSGKRTAATTKPDLEITTGLTGGQKYHIKINQPSGKSVLVAVHL
ncbi:hypothetical protein OU995_15545 [Roseateles sp. SL47]|uniref:hypothetical protein n=1 Tax=Roseateles sp. SL47 TaxID=2995138 RepID=UPI0022704F72|nr:hypothetical protein [Roseateles sp. SL47]WAC71021.1 hypothetical protein OU995_15545 [Roseateles sp. SL47]